MPQDDHGRIMPRHSPMLSQALMNVSEAYALPSMPAINAGSATYISGIYDTIEMLGELDVQYEHLRSIHQCVADASHEYAVTRMATVVEEQEEVQSWFRRQLRHQVPLAVRGD